MDNLNPPILLHDLHWKSTNMRKNYHVNVAMPYFIQKKIILQITIPVSMEAV
jgi:hypothetical protein